MAAYSSAILSLCAKMDACSITSVAAGLGRIIRGGGTKLLLAYLDVRIDGKATNSADLTWSQAAARMADEAVGNLSTRQYEASVPFSWWRCPLIFYEKPFLCIFLFWLMAGLDAPLSDFWLYAAEPPSREKEPRRYVPSNIYREGKAKLDREGKAKVGQQVSLKELLSVNTPRLAEYYRKCWRQVAATINGPRSPHRPRQGHREPLALGREEVPHRAQGRPRRRNTSLHGAPHYSVEAWGPESGVPFGRLRLKRLIGKFRTL